MFDHLLADVFQFAPATQVFHTYFTDVRIGCSIGVAHQLGVELRCVAPLADFISICLQILPYDKDSATQAK